MGKKLFLSSDVSDFEFMYFLGEGSRENKEWPGYRVSLEILPVAMHHEDGLTKEPVMERAMITTLKVLVVRSRANAMPGFGASHYNTFYNTSVKVQEHP